MLKRPVYLRVTCSQKFIFKKIVVAKYFGKLSSRATFVAIQVRPGSWVLISLVVVLLNVFHLRTQAQLYQIESFPSTYVELEDYHSLVIETFGDFSWEKRFVLDFTFPFYNSTYQHVNCDNWSVCWFDEDPDYTMFLMTFDYRWDNVLDTSSIPSDVRYALVTKEGLRALVLQYTRIRLSGDPSIDEFDSFINFQTWFFENGNIEIRFGEINLDNSPAYVPGEGFIAFSSNNALNLGPDVGIRNPEDLDSGLGLSGPYDGFEITNGPSYLTVLPPEGWLLRFKRTTTSTVNETSEITSFLYPNPAKTFISMVGGDLQTYQTAQILDINGRLVRTFRSVSRMDIQDLPSGLYIVRVSAGGSIIQKKFVKV